MLQMRALNHTSRELSITPSQHITWVGLGCGAWVDDEFQARWAKFYLEGQTKEVVEDL